MLGDRDVDTLVMEGRAEQYVHHSHGNGMHSLFSARTGEITEFVDIEQIYFEDSDQLHFVGTGGALPVMTQSQHASEYARIETAIAAYEDGSTDGM